MKNFNYTFIGEVNKLPMSQKKLLSKYNGGSREYETICVIKDKTMMIYSNKPINIRHTVMDDGSSFISNPLIYSQCDAVIVGNLVVKNRHGDVDSFDFSEIM